MQDASNIPSQFIVYAAAFRLAIIAAGIASVVFGYRLLSAAIGQVSKAGGEVKATIGKAQFTMKNLAPGTMFALFGMFLIGVMLYQGMPELKLQKGKDSIVVRGPDASAPAADLVALTARAADLESAGKIPEATEAYEQALDHVAIPANHLALLYLQSNRNTEALGLARIAADLRPYRADALDALAWAYDRTGDHSTALSVEKRAAALDPSYTQKLEALKRGEHR
jgi:tetratricopeptide (TPR) repeat protein